jgi:hypothetical protein
LIDSSFNLVTPPPHIAVRKPAPGPEEKRVRNEEKKATRKGDLKRKNCKKRMKKAPSGRWTLMKCRK